MTVEANIWLGLKQLISSFTESGVDVVMPNTVYHPTATKPYIYVNPVWLAFDEPGISFKCGTEFRGYLECAVRVPVEWSYAAHLGLANRFAAAFTAGDKVTYDSVTIQIHERPKLFMASYLDGPLNRIDLQVPFRSWA